MSDPLHDAVSDSQRGLLVSAYSVSVPQIDPTARFPRAHYRLLEIGLKLHFITMGSHG